MDFGENKVLINLFNEQLKNEITNIVRDKNIDNSGQGLIWWYFKKILTLSDDDIEDAICDGGGDLGIDAVIRDKNDIVHFYQFKSVGNLEKGYPSGDVDKTIGGLEIIIRGQYEKIANTKLKDRIREVLETIPNGYQIHFVSNTAGLEIEATTKLKAFIFTLNAPTDDFIKYADENVVFLQDIFYTKTLPTLNEDITLSLVRSPYMVRAANHDCYTFHIEAETIAKIYEKYGEIILQQNIRMFEGDNATNDAIYRTCTGEESENFYHYNNGVTILCDSSTWDAFSNNLLIVKPQVVNGGQTMRILFKALKNDELKSNVLVPTRIITSQGDKEFAGNVAVNLNNQTRVDGSFLKSNNPRIVQLASALKAIGWYLERREGEIKELSDAEKAKLEMGIGGSLEQKTIALKEGTQAYVATYYENPGLARLNPAKMFLDTLEGGQFNKIFDQSLTAENFARSYVLYKMIETRISEFKSLKRRRKAGDDISSYYCPYYGNAIEGERLYLYEQIVPQATIFTCAISFQLFVNKLNYTIEQLSAEFSQNANDLATVINLIIDTQASDKEKWNKTWQSLLKSQEFFTAIKARIFES